MTGLMSTRPPLCAFLDKAFRKVGRRRRIQASVIVEECDEGNANSREDRSILGDRPRLDDGSIGLAGGHAQLPAHLLGDGIQAAQRAIVTIISPTLSRPGRRSGSARRPRHGAHHHPQRVEPARWRRSGRPGRHTG